MQTFQFHVIEVSLIINLAVVKSIYYIINFSSYIYIQFWLYSFSNNIVSINISLNRQLANLILQLSQIRFYGFNFILLLDHVGPPTTSFDFWKKSTDPHEKKFKYFVFCFLLSYLPCFGRWFLGFLSSILLFLWCLLFGLAFIV